MKHFSKENLDKILAVAKADSERNYLIIYSMYIHGMRASEAVNAIGKKTGITARDVRDGEVVVRRSKGSKTTTHPMTVQEKVLYTKRELPAEGPIFNISRVQLWRIMQRYGKMAGVSLSTCHPHALKHSIAMHSINDSNIHVVKQYLGHKSMNSTAAYLNVDDASASKAVFAAAGL